MADFCILRKQFLDRVIAIDELIAMTDMLRAWYRVSAKDQSASGGGYRCEALVYSFPRSATDAIRSALAASLPQAAIDTSDPDEVRVIGGFCGIDQPADVSVWREVLASPLVRNACVLLRFVMRGITETGTSSDRGATLVICGAPLGDGAILAKAIWPLSHDEIMQSVYVHAPWEQQLRFLSAFEMYLKVGGASADDNKVRLTWHYFSLNGIGFFHTPREQKLGLRLTRLWAELPDDRGPRAFARRLLVPLIGALVAIALALLFMDTGIFAICCLAVAVVFLFWAGRIVWRKLDMVRKYYTAMRKGLGKLYSGPIEQEQIDLSADDAPTLVKYSNDLEALGARHICDIRIVTARGPNDGSRFFALDDAVVSLGLLRKTENLTCFPPRPILLFTTRFVDGSRHVTLNRPVYRRNRRPDSSARCVLDPQQGIADMWALHRRHVDRLIGAGKVPLPARDSAEKVMAQLRAEHDEGRDMWNRYPYSLSDALHDVFKICRREYLAD